MGGVHDSLEVVGLPAKHQIIPRFPGLELQGASG